MDSDWKAVSNVILEQLFLFVGTNLYIVLRLLCKFLFYNVLSLNWIGGVSLATAVARLRH